MCGRYASTRSADDVAAQFDAEVVHGGGAADEPLRPHYNVAPTDPVHVVRRSRRAGRRIVVGMRWGLVPSWSQGRPSGPPLINARAESVASRPAFRAAFARRRCLVPADGWYEWTRREDGGKQPCYVTTRDRSPLVFAGVWETSGEAAAPVLSCAVVTTEAVGPLREVHDRMPLLLARGRWAAWLGEDEVPDVQALLEPAPANLVDELQWWPVGPAVGNVRNNGPALCAPVDLTPVTPVAMDDTLF